MPVITDQMLHVILKSPLNGLVFHISITIIMFTSTQPDYLEAAFSLFEQRLAELEEILQKG